PFGAYASLNADVAGCPVTMELKADTSSQPITEVFTPGADPNGPYVWASAGGATGFVTTSGTGTTCDQYGVSGPVSIGLLFGYTYGGAQGGDTDGSTLRQIATRAATLAR